MAEFTHFNEQGRARMVNVGDKPVTERIAVASSKVLLNAECYEMVKNGGMKKGDVLGVAQVAGIMGAKKTSELIPMCHIVPVNGIDLKLELNDEEKAVLIRAEVSCSGNTGVEMEALTAASVAALTVYDMCKAVQKDIVITNIQLEKKSGGVHGDYERS